MSGSLIGRSGNSLSILSRIVLFVGPHPFLSAMAKISPMHTTEVKEITSGSPSLNCSYARRAHSAIRANPSNMLVSSRKRRICPRDQSRWASSSSMGSSPGQAPQSTLGSTWGVVLSGVLERGTCRRLVSASGMVSKIASPSSRRLIRRASIARALPFGLKCTMPCTVASCPHRGRSNSMSSWLRSNWPGSERPPGIRSRNRPSPCPISSNRPLTTTAREAGIIVCRSLIRGQSDAARTNCCRSGCPGISSYRTSPAPAACPSLRISWITELS